MEEVPGDAPILQDNAPMMLTPSFAGLSLLQNLSQTWGGSMKTNEEIFDEQEEEDVQPYQKDSIPPDRELITTPYDPPVKSIVLEINNKELGKV